MYENLCRGLFIRHLRLKQNNNFQGIGNNYIYRFIDFNQFAANVALIDKPGS